MKNKLPLLFSFPLFFALSGTFTGQIRVLKYESDYKMGESSAVTLYEKDNLYTFNYNDINSYSMNVYRDFAFKNINGDLDLLYNMIIEGFKRFPKQDTMLELPNDIIFLHFDNSSGRTLFQFIHFINKDEKHIGKSPFLSLRDVSKIFNRSMPKLIVKPETVRNNEQ